MGARFWYERTWPLKTNKQVWGAAILGTRMTMDPPKDTDCTLCVRQGVFMDRFIHKENEGPRAETDHVGHSSIASFGVTRAVTLRERRPPPTSMFSFGKETQCSLGQTGGEHLPAGQQSPSTEHVGKECWGGRGGRDTWLRNTAPWGMWSLPNGYPVGLAASACRATLC